MLSAFFRYRLGLLLVLGGLGTGAAAAWPFTVDDAFVLARYSQNLIIEGRYAFNPGGVESDGVTGPLWLLPHLAAGVLGLPSTATAKAAGLGCMLAGVALWWRRLAGRMLGATACVMSLPLWLTSADLAVWPVGGLETGAALLAASVAALAVTARPRPAVVTAGIALGVLPWLRPELSVFGAVLLAGLWLRDRRGGLRAAALAAACAAALVAMRASLFGTLLPLSYYAKPAELAHGLPYVLRWAVIGTSLAGLCLAVLGALRGGPSERLLLWALVAHLAAVALAGGDWMPGFRLIVPVLPIYVVLAARGAAGLFHRRRRALSLSLLALSCALPAADLVTRMAELRAAGHSRESAGAALAGFLSATARRVALVDVGYLGLASGVEVVDLGGITDPAVAHMKGGHLDKRIPQAWLRDRAPDTVVLHSRTPPRTVAGRLLLDAYPVERRVAAMAWVRQNFSLVKHVRYARGYHYVVLQAKGAPKTLDSTTAGSGR